MVKKRVLRREAERLRAEGRRIGMEYMRMWIERRKGVDLERTGRATRG